MNEIIQAIAVNALPVIFAITLHEAAHAYAAKYLGDATAYWQGRMSLNPVKHIDPFGTILIPAIVYIATAGAFLFGYAKPVPVEWGNLRKPKRDMAWVALAGPAANLFMALLWKVLGLGLVAAGVSEPFFLKMAEAGVWFNQLIFAFNLIPIPPLDGGRIMTSLLPSKYAYKFAQIEPYGFFILMALIFLHWLDYWIISVVSVTDAVLGMFVSPLTIFLK